MPRTMPRTVRPGLPRRGFTLMEMLVVLAIVALLLTLATPRYFGSLEKSREVALKENLRVMRVTIDKFYGDKGRYPEALQELVEAGYLREVPMDPVTESASSWVAVPPRQSDLQGVADVRSGASGQSRDGTAFASF
ncbi:type II secretion system protein [Aquabacterium sp.]|uniref:type II secretion system protein n=1 Tax=Aquabacterium sp. TaxID=1872578 RepID=UPI0035C66327